MVKSDICSNSYVILLFLSDTVGFFGEDTVFSPLLNQFFSRVKNYYLC